MCGEMSGEMCGEILAHLEEYELRHLGTRMREGAHANKLPSRQHHSSEGAKPGAIWRWRVACRELWGGGSATAVTELRGGAHAGEGERRPWKGGGGEEIWETRADGELGRSGVIWGDLGRCGVDARLQLVGREGLRFCEVEDVEGFEEEGLGDWVGHRRVAYQ